MGAASQFNPSNVWQNAEPYVPLLSHREVPAASWLAIDHPQA